ncbi:MAG: DUF2058 family protein [Pseudomonadota bacterium]|nr:DUF2058 family protein [Pseudomonadota bacterium]
MSDTLRDQLLGLGFKAAPKPEKNPQGKPPRRDSQAAGRKQGGKPAPKAGQGRPAHKPKGGEMDLAKAYAIRAQSEKDERIEAERQKQEAARLRREARAKLAEFLAGKELNDAAAEIARHFEYGGKIKRIYVNADQLAALNAGQLGVIQHNGRYLLVDAATLAAAEAIFADAIALKIDPDAPATDAPYADPKYQVPDDLVW